MKKLLLICFLLAILLLITIGANAQYMWNAGTTEEGSIGYTLIGILSEVINTYSGNDIFMTPIAYTKSLVGLKGLDQKEVVSMYASSQTFEQVINKEGPFDPKIYEWTAPITQMMWMYDLDYGFIIRKSDADKIKSWSDLAYRKVWPQMLGTTSYELIKAELGPDGLDIWDKLNLKTFEISHVADALRSGEVDAVSANSMGGNIVGWTQEVLARVDSVMLAPTPEELEKIQKNIEFISISTTNPEDFQQDVGLTKPLLSPSLGVVYMVDPNVPEEAVYQAVKTAFENATEMANSVSTWKKFSQDPWAYNLPYLKKYKEKGVPIHPGALRYFRELGHDTKLLGLE